MGLLEQIFGDHKCLRHLNFEFLPKNINDENNLHFLFDGYDDIKINI